jgi:hypothetical protein
MKRKEGGKGERACEGLGREKRAGKERGPVKA